jgi:hypothetical protein
MVMLILGLVAFPALIGLLIIYHVMIRGKRWPADKSNVINHIRLVWFALTREDKFVGLFPWLKNDEWENMHGDS